MIDLSERIWIIHNIIDQANELIRIVRKKNVDARSGWFNPSKITIKKRYVRQRLNYRARNQLPYKIRLICKHE